MGRIAGAYGVASEWGRCFPTPARLAELKPEQLPMPQSRACAIRDMSQAVAAGDIDLAAAVDPQTLMTQLQEIKGIGQWTANYIGMRALNDPDAFVHNDLILLQVAKRKLGITSPRALLQRSYQWRPWQAYAGMHLWRHGA
jgi:AraC family transcriptional regulator of adaptative response / DNA-3-methyladenine glycosylase II